MPIQLGSTGVDDAHAVVVGDDDVVRLHQGTGAHERLIDGAKRGFHRTLREDSLGPDREAHVFQLACVAHTGIYDEADATAREGRDGQQISEIAIVAWRCRGDNEHVTFAHMLEGEVNHPIVAWGDRNGDGRASDRASFEDWTHVGSEQTGASLRLVNRRDAGGGKTGEDGRRSIACRTRIGNFHELRSSGQSRRSCDRARRSIRSNRQLSSAPFDGGPVKFVASVWTWRIAQWREPTQSIVNASRPAPRLVSMWVRPVMILTRSL